MTDQRSPLVSSPCATSGTAQAKAVDTAGAGTVTYDEIQWFWAPEAAQNCGEDRATPGGAWCTDYHCRNVNDRLAPLARPGGDHHDGPEQAAAGVGYVRAARRAGEQRA
jgi:hypothetical protein